MEEKILKKLLFVFVSILTVSVSIFAQDFVETRVGFSEEGATYRYLDFNHTFENGGVVDLAHYGSPGQNELWVGAGKFVKFGEATSATFAVYGVVGKENGQVGVGVSSWGSTHTKKMGVNWQTYAFIPAKGSVPKYLAIDSLDATYKLNKRVEVGASMGMFWVENNANLIAGPLLRINDKLGSTNFSFRTGARNEFLVGRTFNFSLSKLL